MEQARILVADDEEGIRELLREQLDAARRFCPNAWQRLAPMRENWKPSSPVQVLRLTMASCCPGASFWYPRLRAHH